MTMVTADGRRGDMLAGIIYETSRKMMKDLAGLDLRALAWEELSGRGPAIRFDIMGDVNGCMDFSFDQGLADVLVARWLADMGEVPSGTEAATEALAELGNIFLGHMEGKFDELGLTGTISPPQQAGEPPAEAKWRAPPLKIMLECGHGRIAIELYYLAGAEGTDVVGKDPVTFLVVDDSPIIRRKLRNILEGNGYKVLGEAGDGVQALKLYRELSPDVVTLDLIMPSMGGLETLRALKQMDPEARVLMVSAMTSRKKVLEAARLGASHYIIKPFEEAKVLEVIRDLLNET